MKKAKLGLAGLCSPIESGGERYEELMTAAEKALTEAGVEVIAAKTCVLSSGDALKVCDQFKEKEVDAVALINVTWVMDSLTYLFVQELPVPMIMWAVPYPETFSIGCVQNFASVLKEEKIPFEYVYGLPDDAELIEKVKKVAFAGKVIKKVKGMRIALAGPRQTWRVAGPQDMSLEEWDFSRSLGVTLAHIEMEEIFDAAEKISDEKAKEILETLKTRTGTVKCEEECMIWAAKVYKATKELILSYGLDGLAGECYPRYGGQLNQAASWLADEGFVVDTEGDIAHTLVQLIMNMAAEGTPCILGEAGAFNEQEDYLYVCHEGSSAASVSEALDLVTVNPAGGTSTFIGTPVKKMEHVTFCDFQGSAGKYQLLIAGGSTLEVSHEEWVNAGEKMVMKLRADELNAKEVIQKMIRHGFHHHLVVKEGDCREQLKLICRYMGIEVVEM